MQFGGGARGGDSFGDFIDALTKPHQRDNRSDALSQEAEFGNQTAALTSRFIFPGRTPFAAYLEYAGEDSSYEGNYRLGNCGALGRHHVPAPVAALRPHVRGERVAERLVHARHLPGRDDRARDTCSAIGVRTDACSSTTSARRRTCSDSDGRRRSAGCCSCGRAPSPTKATAPNDYERGYDVALSYSRALHGFTAGGELLAGRDVFGESFSRLAGFVRFGDEWDGGGGDGWADDVTRPRGAELFVDAGINFSELAIRLDGSPAHTESLGVAPHFAIGARRAVSERSDLGVRAEIDDIDGDMLFSVRALDYRYRFANPLALSLFARRVAPGSRHAGLRLLLRSRRAMAQPAAQHGCEPRFPLRRQDRARQAVAERSCHREAARQLLRPDRRDALAQLSLVT